MKNAWQASAILSRSRSEKVIPRSNSICDVADVQRDLLHRSPETAHNWNTFSNIYAVPFLRPFAANCTFSQLSDTIIWFVEDLRKGLNS